MKALVISKPKIFSNHKVTAEKLRQSKSNLQKYIDHGIVEHAYAIIEGGSAYVVNVNSEQELQDGIKANNLTELSDVEVIPVENLL